MEKASVAMLIDWENIKKSTITDKTLNCPPDIITLKKIARRFGDLTIARAYANWADMQHEFDMETFSEQDIEPIYVKTKVYKEGEGEIIKGSVDIRMACDSIELLFQSPGLSTFIIASGDGGFGHVVARLKAYGKKTVMIGVRSTTSDRLTMICDEVIYYDDCVSGLRFGTIDDNIRDAVIRFEAAVAHIRRSKADNSLKGIKQHIRKFAHLDFEEEEIGLPTFRHLAFLAEKEGRVKIDSTASPARAFCLNDESSDEGKQLYSKDLWKILIEGVPANVPFRRNTLMDLMRSKSALPDDDEIRSFIENARRSGVLWSKQAQYFNDKAAKIVTGLEYFLNPSNPRVQVYQKL